MHYTHILFGQHLDHLYSRDFVHLDSYWLACHQNHMVQTANNHHSHNIHTWCCLSNKSDAPGLDWGIWKLHSMHK